MNNLIRKDFLVLTKPRNILIVLFYAIFLGVFMKSPESSALLITIFLIMDLINQEEKHKTHKFIISLPVKRSNIITSKYIEGILFFAFGIFLTLCLMYFNSLLTGELFTVNLNNLWISTILIILIMSVYFPLYFKFGKVTFYIILICVIGILAIIFYVEENSSVTFIPDELLGTVTENSSIYMIIGSLTIILLFFFSHKLSVKIYKKKEI